MLRARGTLPLRNPRGSDGAHAAPFRTSTASSLKMFPVGRWKHPSKETLEEVFSSALLAGDSEFGRIVHEMEEASNTLKSAAPNTQIVGNALQLAIWWAVRQTLLERELRSLALTDDLTGLHNRRGFLVSATQQLKLARRNAQGLLLFFADVDNLKEINDSYGHQEGDLALIRVADALEQTFRDSDTLARLGGDEFGVVALEASSQNKEGILRRLEKNLEKSNADANEFRYELSLSVGVAGFDPTYFVSLEELMAQADQAMYEQKQTQPKSSVNKR
jgi:diguanylate cyclase (GGDEF)-like protein